jgi:hypothetical protein
VKVARAQQLHHESDSCNVLENYFAILCVQKHFPGPKIFFRVLCMLFAEITPLLQFIKVKIIPEKSLSALFTLTILELKT